MYSSNGLIGKTPRGWAGMGAAPKITDKKTLQILVPFNALSPMHFNEVAQKTLVEEVRAGRLIFKEGDRDNQSVYLLEGEITLLAGNETVGAVSAGSDAARHPIAQQQPRQVSARAKSNVVVARVDSSLLDIMLTWDQSSGYEVAEISEDDDDDWMTRILQSQAFLKLPPSNIQRLLMRVESVPVTAGDVIIRQGGDGDYFYIIKTGRCMVTRKPSANAKEVKLAELADGDAFGEDALVSDAKRNATITMMTDGVLMRLAKKDFVELLKEPLLAKLNYQDAAAKVAKGAAWLDVRLPGEYENTHIRGSRNIPLSALRLEANGLDPATKYIVCCDTGRRSASAAFVLSQRGFEVFVLDEGLAAVPADALDGNAAVTPAVVAPETAEVVALKPAGPTAVHLAPPAPDSAAAAALQQRIDALQQEKQRLEAAHQQLGGRVGGLQEELARVRDESREQILELEQILADVRRDHGAARAELQAAQEALNAQRETAGMSRAEAQALTGELAARSEREAQLRSELTQLRADLAELEAARESGRRQADDGAADRAGLLVRIAELESSAAQVETQQAQIAALESELKAAVEQSAQTLARHTEQAERLGEIESALQRATAALEQAQQESEQRLADAQAEHLQTLNRVHTEAADRQAALQAALDEAASRQAEMERRIAAAESQSQAAVAEQQALRQTVEALQEQLEGERSTLVDQRVALDSAVEELAGLRAIQASAAESARLESEGLRVELEAERAARGVVLAERDSAERAVAEAAQYRSDLERQLHAARASVEALQADSSTQVQQLRAELDAVREQLTAGVAEREGLAAVRAALQSECDALQAALGSAQAAEQTTRLESAAQLQQLQSELSALREQAAAAADTRDALATAHASAEAERADLQALLEETRTQLRSEADARAALAADLLAEQTRATELDAALQTQTGAAEALQERLQAAAQTLAASEAAYAGLQQTYAADQSVLAELRAQLDAERDLRRADGQLRELLEQQLAESQSESVQRDQQQQATIAALRADLTEIEQARAELRQQQLDAAAGQDEQLQQLARLRDELHAARAQLEDTNSARREIEGRLDEMSAAATDARDRLEQLEQAHGQALLDTEQRVRAALEQQIGELRSELDGARAALAREQSQRGNLEQAQQAQFAAAQAESTERLEQAEAALREREQALSAADSARQALESELAAERAAALDQQQALQAELEQLRSVTTADLTAMQERMRQLQEDLQAARRLGAGGSADEEIERLRLLLDEAREAADSARAEAEQWREQADSAGADSGAAARADAELAALRSQLADVQGRVAEAVQWRETAEQELARLRDSAQAQSSVATHVPPQAEAPRRNGVWLGLAAGLVAGALAAGAVLQFGGGAIAPSATTAAEAHPAPTLPVPVQPPASTAVTTPVAPAAAAPAPTVGKPALAKGRSWQDALSDGSRGPRLIEIAATGFAMGSSANSLDFDERPRHEVKLRGFAVSQREITFEEYDAFARATGRRLPDDKGWGRGRQPVINVNWEEAVAYTRWLSEQTGHRYRLPTEAEWEYVAGGFAGTLYWWGNVPGEGRANCFNCGSEWDAKSPAPAGSFAANPLGVSDTAGNVAEWVQDCYHAGYDGAPGDGSAWVDVGCARRVVRGGGFNSPASTLRTAKRDQQPANVRTDDVGFRVVREL